MTPGTSNPRRALAGAVLASASATMGGATVVFTRYILPQTDPFSLPMARYGIGALVLIAIVYGFGHGRRIAPRDWAGLAILAFVFYTAFPLVFARALEDTTAARAAIVYTSMPLMALTFGTLIGKERMTWRKIAAVGIALGGIMVTLGDTAGPAAPDAWRGDLFMALGAFFCATYVLFARGLVARYGGLTVTAVQMLLGSLMLVPIAFVFGDPLGGSLAFDAEGWIILLALAIPGAALMVLMYVLAINMTTPTGVTMTVGFNPLSSIVLGAVVLGEPATARVLVGFFAIVCAVILANLERGRG